MRKLRTEKEIIDAWKGSSPTTPLVSICCVTYNHEPFIEDALEGFLIQETDFPFEILIHDDASTDRTADIIREYEAAYPNLIRPVYQTENQHSKGNNPLLLILKKVKGKYIALCEGDDCWTVPCKLRKQIKFLQANPEYSMCFHNVLIKYENGQLSKEFSQLENRDYSGYELFDKWQSPTCSIVFRSSMYKPFVGSKIFFGDIVIFLDLAKNGKIYCFNEIMGIYRRHDSNITKDYTFEIRKRLILQYEYMNKIYKKKYSRIIKRKIIEHCYSILYKVSKDKEERLFALINLLKCESKLLFSKRYWSLVYTYFIKN